MAGKRLTKKDVPLGGVYIGRPRKFSVDDYGKTLYKVNVSYGGNTRRFIVTKKMGREFEKLVKYGNSLSTMTERMSYFQSLLSDYSVLDEKLQLQMFKTNFIKRFRAGLDEHGMADYLTVSGDVPVEVKEDIKFIKERMQNITINELKDIYDEYSDLFSSVGDYYNVLTKYASMPESQYKEKDRKQLKKPLKIYIL